MDTATKIAMLEAEIKRLQLVVRRLTEQVRNSNVGKEKQCV